VMIQKKVKFSVLGFLKSAYARRPLFVLRVVFVFFTGLSVFFYACYAQPFELHLTEHSNVLILSALYSIASMVVLAGNFIVAKSFSFFSRYSRLTLFVYFMVSGVVLYASLLWVINLLWHPQVSFNLPAESLKEAFIQALFPLIVAVNSIERSQYINYIKAIEYLKKHDTPIEEADNDTLVTIYTELKQEFQVMNNHLLCIEADDNYSVVYHREKGKTTKTLLRVMLKNVEEQLKDQKNIIRCHRSFMINIDQVQRVSGNSQGYKFGIQDIEVSIPVSRNFPRNVIEIIRQRCENKAKQ
jgi:hypothetical protein